MRRQNNLFYKHDSGKELKDYTLILEANGKESATQISHLNYNGNTISKDQDDKDFESLRITDASIKSHQANRFGLIKISGGHI